MGLTEDLTVEVKRIFKDIWDITDGRVVPEPKDVPFGNKGVALDATVLYADLVDSTVLVDKQKRGTAAEVYKTYLHCAGKIIRNQDGVITAYDGDRVMAIFLGDRKNNNATNAALKIERARSLIINPLFQEQYPGVSYAIRHRIGIASGKLMAARTGVWGANDLVWVGSPANHAAKLTTLVKFPIWITKPVFDVLDAPLKAPGIWEARLWTAMGQTIYGTTRRHASL